MKNGLGKCLSGLTLLALLVLVPAAGAGAAKPPGVFDGKSFSVKPATISGFSLSNQQNRRVKLLIGGPDATRNDPGAIEWKRWSRKKAIGTGTGWAIGCSNSCGLGNPWNGERVRVTAYRNKKGKFARLKVFQWTAWMTNPSPNRENYRIAMTYTGSKRPGSGWFVFAFNDGWPIQPR